MRKIYSKFKAIEVVGKGWRVATDDEDEIVVARIPPYIKHPRIVAKALSSALTNSKLALTDLI